MKKIRKVIRTVAITLAGLTLFLTILITSFIYMSPQFGGKPANDQQQKFSTSGHYEDGKFQNQIPTTLSLGFRKTVSVMWDFFFADVPGKTPELPLSVEWLDPANIASRSPDIARLTWFGHSACLLEIDGKKIFIDPMLGQYAGPLPLLSPKRYSQELPIEIEALPFIDAVIISHDHYDHLDYGSILKLKEKSGHFYVPLGVGSHLVDWGIPKEKITELDWWEEVRFEKFAFICAPARHFSGRGLTNNQTLWSSWIILSESQRFYFSGDSGYGPHFKEIGERYGPFDFVMMECGQYNMRWPEIHMMPEETVQATLDVKGKILLPIHWGAFSLAMHPWTDPVIRVTAEAKRVQVKVATPRIGEPVLLDYKNIPDSRWWQTTSQMAK